MHPRCDHNPGKSMPPYLARSFTHHLEEVGAPEMLTEQNIYTWNTEQWDKWLFSSIIYWKNCKTPIWNRRILLGKRKAFSNSLQLSRVLATPDFTSQLWSHTWWDLDNLKPHFRSTGLQGILPDTISTLHTLGILNDACNSTIKCSFLDKGWAFTDIHILI